MTAAAPRIVVLLERPGSEPQRPSSEPHPPRRSDTEPGLENPLLGGSGRAALAVAVGLREELDGTVTALSLGAESRQRAALEAALISRCDRAVCVVDDADPEHPFEECDYLAVATALAAAVAHIGCDILICGDLSEDEREGAVGPAVADILAFPHLTGVVDVRPGEPDRAVDVELCGAGVFHRFRCATPVVLCVRAYSNRPAPDLPSASSRPTSAAGDTMADALLAATVADATADSLRPIERLSLGDLGVDLATLDRPARGVLRPARPAHSVAEITGAADLVARLIDDRLLP